MANDRNRRNDLTAVSLVQHTLSGDAFCLYCMKFTSAGIYEPAGDAAEGDFAFCPECADLKGAVSVIHAYSQGWIHLSFNEEQMFAGILALSMTLDGLDFNEIDATTLDRIRKQFEPEVIKAFETAYGTDLGTVFEESLAYNEAVIAQPELVN